MNVQVLIKNSVIACLCLSLSGVLSPLALANESSPLVPMSFEPTADLSSDLLAQAKPVEAILSAFKSLKEEEQEKALRLMSAALERLESVLQDQPQLFEKLRSDIAQMGLEKHPDLSPEVKSSAARFSTMSVDQFTAILKYLRCHLDSAYAGGVMLAGYYGSQALVLLVVAPAAIIYFVAKAGLNVLHIPVPGWATDTLGLSLLPAAVLFFSSILFVGEHGDSAACKMDH